MSGPWEKYGAETPAPWVKYSGQDETNIPRDLAASGGSGLVIAHPDIALMEVRL